MKNENRSESEERVYLDWLVEQPVLSARDVVACLDDNGNIDLLRLKKAIEEKIPKQ